MDGRKEGRGQAGHGDGDGDGDGMRAMEVKEKRAMHGALSEL